MMKKMLIYKHIRTILFNTETDNESIKGDIILNTDNLKLLRQASEIGYLEQEAIVNGISHSIEDIAPSEDIGTVKLLPFILNDYYLSEIPGAFFKKFSSSFKVPSNLYIHSEFIKPLFDENVFVARLLFAKTVNDILDTLKDYKKENLDNIEYFLHSNEPIIIKTIYSDSIEVFNKEVEEVLQLISLDFKKEIYKSYLKIQIINFLKNIPDSERFNVLLNNFGSIYLNFKNSVELYFQNFDYQKSINEVQEKKIDLVKKIHGVVNEIGGKVITIPLGYFLIIKEINMDNHFALINVILLVISVVYVLIIETSLINQFNYLKIIKTEVEVYLANIEKHESILGIFGVYKSDLNNSIQLQKSILWSLRASLWLMPIFILMVLFASLINKIFSLIYSLI